MMLASILVLSILTNVLLVGSILFQRKAHRRLEAKVNRLSSSYTQDNRKLSKKLQRVSAKHDRNLKSLENLSQAIRSVLVVQSQVAFDRHVDPIPNKIAEY